MNKEVALVLTITFSAPANTKLRINSSISRMPVPSSFLVALQDAQV
jgi:hypothetical protein